jgi:predicted phage tail protein
MTERNPPGENLAAQADELRREIARTRDQLGETIAALAAKTDVKARLQDSAQAARVRVQERLHQAVGGASTRAGQARDRVAGAVPGTVRTAPAGIGLAALAAGVLAAVVVMVIVRRRR